ncbi:hypothetical protein TESG_04403 [Trichophyton tonsurans CBS 112818]|uniref:Uncharacterized protein n=2 Tax=Trichophyton TaxID=5550 RepID=F2PHH2_TRIEC|nr:hypothetical protein TESG_04403 [Trichophyton tonsurans CBS 112818]EGE01340.1 hypothetical protein TEQG_00393 [Trichophyton equinum CBS 127.97]
MDSITKSGDRPPMRLLRSNAPPSPPQVLSAQKLFTIIRNKILQAQGYKDLVFENVPPETGSLVIDSLDEDPDVENSCARLGYNSFTLTIKDSILFFNSLIFETGWLEFAPRIHHDKDLCSVIRGIVKAYGRNSVGGPQLLQTETIFPAPPNPEAQTIPITRGQLMGPNLLAGRNPGDVHQLSVDLFRRAAGKLVRREGYTPA